ncbi:MAG: hypothetical protein ACRC1J_04820, partial [Sandaracinobacteroides sp.]
MISLHPPKCLWSRRKLGFQAELELPSAQTQVEMAMSAFDKFLDVHRCRVSLRKLSPTATAPTF